jgi:hypothetical protein
MIGITDKLAIIISMFDNNIKIFKIYSLIQLKESYSYGYFKLNNKENRLSFFDVPTNKEIFSLLIKYKIRIESMELCIEKTESTCDFNNILNIFITGPSYVSASLCIEETLKYSNIVDVLVYTFNNSSETTIFQDNEFNEQIGVDYNVKKMALIDYIESIKPEFHTAVPYVE